MPQPRRQLLEFAALHALSAHLQAGEVLAPVALLPPVSRVLLQTEEPPPAAKRFLESVAGALAAQMGAGLLCVDTLLLASLAGGVLGRSPEALMPAFNGGGGSSGAAAAASKLELAWLALRGALFSLEQPTVVYFRGAEQLLCGSYEAHDPFQAAFGGGGSQEELALEGAAPAAPLVLLGGVSVDESAGALAGARPQRRGAGGGGGEEEEEGEGGLRPRAAGVAGPAGGDGSGDLEGLEGDELGLGDLLLSLSRLAGEGQRPNSRKLLLRTFPTRVRLLPPPAGPAALLHQQRLARDEAEEAEEENFRGASAVAAATGVALPPKSSGVYGNSKVLSRGDWRKAISWAVTLETLQAKQRQLAAEARAEEEAEAAAVAALQQRARQAQQAGRPECREGSSGTAPGSSPGTPADTGLRRRRQPATASSTSAPASSRTARRQQPAATLLTQAATGLLHTLNPVRLVTLPWRVARSAAGAAAEALAGLPVVGWLFERRLSMAQLEAELAELEEELQRLAQLETSSGSGGEGDGSQGGGVPSSRSVGGGGGGGSGTLRLSEASVRYGLGMLARSAGGPRQAVEPSNRYERQLLAEVLAPEDCGRGFSEVGALDEAKQALREAVQLPLQHPELFAGGTLARPSRGVLLFGPPGTGKTLVARAAAAECGAAFLALSPSALTSKWFGESTKLLRAAFTLAAKLSPCVIFIDEVDALLGRRNSLREHEALREMKNELMSQWEGIRPGRTRIMVLGATNRPQDLDEAALRRFTHRVFIGLPNRAARTAILRIILADERLAGHVSVDRLAERTEGYSGSDLRQLCVAAAMRPVRAFLEHSSEEAAAEGAATEPATAGNSREPVKETAAAAAAAAAAGEDAAASEEAAAAAVADGGVGGEQAEEQHEVSSGASGAGPAQASPPGSVPASVSSRAASGAASLALVPRLDSLLRQAERIASTPRNPRTDLRPISMADFEAALAEVGSSVSPDSAAVQELNEWNAQYGTTGSKAGVKSRRLSYFT
ncbi:ATPase family AAA domain-containing 1 [Micractinium conductrix]|uniref:ATPase family AAA domain-containing 1 n=1 Tax=Micractinium conductrix TaxID=554055 RepID=A0A2P6VMP5_9CHLO|nr:ATPase family AAA domain-containing 1 [Micractinium conductrix]|eukprot:PSC75359.1 ATPase family AAA domain-containing 1 [Micractinium conductrix]